MFKDLHAEYLNVEQCDISAIEFDGLESVGGYIAKKLRKKHPELGILATGNKEGSYIDQVSEGSLYKPTQRFLNNLLHLSKIFNNEGFKPTQNFMKNLLNKSNQVNVPEEAKKLFFKCKIYFCIRRHNRILSDSKSGKRKLQKTIM